MMHSHHPDASSEHHYHALHGDADDGLGDNHLPQQHPQHHHNHHEDSLWDQLNDEQSREVQQHQSRFHHAAPHSRSHPLNIMWSMAAQTAERVGSTLHSTVSSAQQAWREQQQQQQYTSHHPYAASSSSNSNNHGRQRTRRRTSQQYYTPPPSTTTLDEFDLQFRISEDLRPVLEEGDEQDALLMDPSHHHHHPIQSSNPKQQHTHQQPPAPSNSSGSSSSSLPSSRPLKGYPFVVLQSFNRQQILSEQDTWGIPSNVDVFLTRLYQYFYHRGMVPMTCQFFLEMASLLFTLWLSRILLARVDWQSLATCKEEASCHAHWSDYYRDAQHRPLSWPAYLLIQGYTLLVLSYAAFQAWSFWQSLLHAAQCRTILHDKLGLSERKLQGGALAWDDVVKALANSQATGSYRVVFNPSDDNHYNTNTSATNTNDSERIRENNVQPTSNDSSLRQQTQQQQQQQQQGLPTALDPLSVAQRIMRKENFLIAFFNQGLLDVTIGGRQYWCSTLEWSIYTCILNFMFNHKYELRPAFCLDSASLERRLQVCGIVHLLLLPFAILFVTLNFLLRHVYDARSTRQYMGHQQWSPIALWTFREFNELPHMFEQRLDPSYAAGTKYVSLFGTSEWIAAFGKLLVFLGGAVGGVLILLGILNDAILLHVQLWGRNLLWYVGMSGIVYSVGKALLPTKEATPSVIRNLFENMDTALKNVAQYTHYYPDHWKGRGWDATVYKSFKQLFDTKVKLFLFELAALILAPYILCFKLSKCAPAICEFCLVSKARMAAGSGDVCGFSTFDFDTFGDEAWEGRTLGKSVLLHNQQPTDPLDTNNRLAGESLAESIMRTGNLEDATRLHPKPRAREGKMEKSFFTFQSAHPGWKWSQSGQSLVDRVEEYRVAAMTRERELHIEAAARELETLARLEQKLSSMPPKMQQSQLSPQLQESFQTPADAGAGIYQRHDQTNPYQLDHPLGIPSLHHISNEQRSIPNQPSPSESPNRTQHVSVHPDLVPSDALRQPSPTTTTTASVLGLSSTDVTKLFLSRSVMMEDESLSLHTVDPSVHGIDQSSSTRQYYWLERFHEHLEAQNARQNANEQHQQQHQIPPSWSSGNNSRHEPFVSRSMPIPSTTTTPTIPENQDGRPSPPRGTGRDATSASSMV